MTKVISLIQQKGGVGKTTISVHLATQLKELFPSFQIAIADADPQQSSTTWINLGQGKAGVDAHKIDCTDDIEMLDDCLKEINADVIIIDLPPGITKITENVALLSDLMLIPIGASALDIYASAPSLRLCRETIMSSPNKQFMLVPNRVVLNTAAGRDLRVLLSSHGPVSKATLCHRIAYADSVVAGVGINKYAPTSPAAQEIGLLAEEVANLLNLSGGN